MYLDDGETLYFQMFGTLRKQGDNVGTMEAPIEACKGIAGGVKIPIYLLAILYSKPSIGFSVQTMLVGILQPIPWNLS